MIQLPDLTATSLAGLPAATQQSRVRRLFIQPLLRALASAGVRRWVLINALAAELADLEQMEEE